MPPKVLSKVLKIPLKEAELVTKFVDLDQDGFLDDYDFVCMVGLFTKASLKEKLESIFYLFDEDFSQIINEAELRKFVICILSVNEDGRKIKKEQV